MLQRLQLLLVAHSLQQWVTARGDSDACSAEMGAGSKTDELDVFQTAPFGVCPQETLGLGLLWQKVGTTASGAAYYKAIDQSLWIYYDPSCDGKLEPLWVIGARPPSELKTSILNGDGQCKILADVPAKEFSNPLTLELGSHKWEFACMGFAKAALILEFPPSPDKLHISGSSAWMSCVNGDYEVAGVTAIGAKYYQSTFLACDGYHSYLYYDPGCGHSINPAWVIASIKPDLSRFSSLGQNLTACADSADKCWKWSSFLPLGNSTWQLLTYWNGYAPWELNIVSKDLSNMSVGDNAGLPSQSMHPVPGITDGAPRPGRQVRSVRELGIQLDVKALVVSEFHGASSHSLVRRYTDILTRTSPTQRKTKTHPHALLVLGSAEARKSFSVRFLAGLYRPPGAVVVSEEGILQKSGAWKSSQELCEATAPGLGCSDLYNYFDDEVSKLQMAIQVNVVQEHWDLEFVDTGADMQSTRQMIDTWLEHGYGVTAVGIIASETSSQSRAEPGRSFSSAAWQKSIRAIRAISLHLQARKQLLDMHGGSSVMTLLDDSGELPASISLDSLDSLFA